MSCSDQKWAEIKRILGHAGVNVDADTVMIGKRPLRDELDRIAVEYAELANLKNFTTTKQLRDIVGDAIGQIDAMRETFAPDRIETYYAGDEEAAELRGMLDHIKATLQHHHKVNQFSEAHNAPQIVQVGPIWISKDWLEDNEFEAIAMEKRGSNASKDAADSYRRQLVHVWQQVAPRKAKRSRLIDFLVTVTGDSEAAIKTWVYRSVEKLQ